MSPSIQLQTAFQNVLENFKNSPAMQRLNPQQFTVEHYKSYLRETYYYTRDNPQLQALACTYFRGSDRQFVKQFLKHAISEIGHDDLALNDLVYLGGGEIEQIRNANPLPNTLALNAFAFYQVYTQNPIGYLGYLYFLEYLPTSSGTGYMQLLENLGIPKEAMTFIHEHATVDHAHNRLMDKYVDGLIQTQDDLDSIIYVIQATGKLYADMLLAAFETVEKPQNFGINSEEKNRWNASKSVVEE